MMWFLGSCVVLALMMSFLGLFVSLVRAGEVQRIADPEEGVIPYLEYRVECLEKERDEWRKSQAAKNVPTQKKSEEETCGVEESVTIM